MLEKNLKKEELDALPVKGIADIDVDQVFQSILYDAGGNAIGKTSNFEFNSFTPYPAVLSSLNTASGGLRGKLLSWDEISKMSFKDNEWLVRTLVPKYGLTFIAGISGEKKTWFAMHMAYCIATGSHLLGSEKFPTKQSKVLYLDAEMGPRELLRRGNKLGYGEIPSDSLRFLSGESIDLRNQENFEELVELINAQGFEVVFIDTLRGVAGGMNEDKAEDVRAFLQRFNELKNKGTSVIFLDHFRKPARNEGSAPKKEHLLGSQDKVASAESIIALKSDQQSPGFAVYHLKSRNSIGAPTFMGLMKDVGESRIRFQFEGEYDEQTSKMDLAKVTIPQLIAQGKMTTNEILESMLKGYQVGDRYVRDALRQLVQEGKLEVTKVSRQNAYTNTGVGVLPSFDEVGNTLDN